MCCNFHGTVLCYEWMLHIAVMLHSNFFAPCNFVMNSTCYTTQFAMVLHYISVITFRLPALAETYLVNKQRTQIIFRKPGTYVRTKQFANCSQMVHKPNACICGWDGKHVLCFLQMLLHTINHENLSVFSANTKVIGCAMCPVFASGSQKINLPHN